MFYLLLTLNMAKICCPTYFKGTRFLPADGRQCPCSRIPMISKNESFQGMDEAIVEVDLWSRL